MDYKFRFFLICNKDITRKTTVKSLQKIKTQILSTVILTSRATTHRINTPSLSPLFSFSLMDRAASAPLSPCWVGFLRIFRNSFSTKEIVIFQSSSLIIEYLWFYPRLEFVLFDYSCFNLLSNCLLSLSLYFRVIGYYWNVCIFAAINITGNTL